MTEGEFGPRVGIWRILDLLDKYEIKATFFVPGWTAESYPEPVKEIDKRGHEVAHHGYNHLWANKLNIEEERSEIEKGIDVKDENCYGFSGIERSIMNLVLSPDKKEVLLYILGQPIKLTGGANVTTTDS